jgi:hypothetical protein
MIRSLFERAARQGAKLYLVMAVCNALFILLALALSPSAPPSASPSPQPAQLPSSPYIGYQVLVHIVSGFLAGAVSLDPAVALVGAGLGPLVDLDHLGFFAGLPVDARVGHSFLLVALVVLLDWRLHFWDKGTRNFFLFISLEYSVHLAVAPPGFPLLAPLSASIFDFPSIIPAALSAVLAVAFLADSLTRRRRASPWLGAKRAIG